MKNKLSWLAGPYVLWMALVVIVPILLVVVYAFTTSGETAADIGGFTLDNFSRMGTYTVIFARSFQLALVATLVCLLIGYPLAYVMAKEGPGFQDGQGGPRLSEGGHGHHHAAHVGQFPAAHLRLDGYSGKQRNPEQLL